jgi:hypothetical protein
LKDKFCLKNSRNFYEFIVYSLIVVARCRWT